MDRPLEIAFHNLDSSPSLEAEIRESVARLESRHPHLIGCRVSVEAQHQQHRTGNLFEVHVVLSVRGGRDLAVSREPHKAKQRYANPDVRSAMRDAFRTADRQLQTHKEQLREDTTAPSGSALAGQVTQLLPGADHGFILDNTGTQLYFHRDSVTNADFATLKEGDPVHYVEEEGDGGPVAAKVRLATGPAA